ncbi:hypothetical protein ABS642_03445 [Microbacterium sp. A8/3-1]|uniref:Uncharacterized protein n=1 Tax=Microbacterium sp. A8/3-1 TaxID=3160749 RepID=A0AAU7VZ78_9MICO
MLTPLPCSASVSKNATASDISQPHPPEGRLRDVVLDVSGVLAMRSVPQPLTVPGGAAVPGKPLIQAIEKAARILDRAGLPSPDYSLRDVLDVPGIDRENIASWGHGMQLHYVMSAGVSHSPVPIGQQVEKALAEAVRAVSIGRAVEIKS